MIRFSVYADGSSGGNSTGAIGWGWVVVRGTQSPADASVLLNPQILCCGSGGYPEGTNNVAELMAGREGLRALLQHPALISEKRPYRIELVSDSMYVLGLADGRYAASKNVALAEHVRDICRDNFVSTRWVKGHNGDPLNEVCDRLAKHGKALFQPQGVKSTSRTRKNARKGILGLDGKLVPE